MKKKVIITAGVAAIALGVWFFASRGSAIKLKESDFEMNGLLEYAAKFNIKVYVLEVNHRLERNIEAECRKIRYNYFYDLTRHYKYYATLVAHHQDDLIETYLLQKDRQNCPIFYGIKENTVIRNVRIIRPLLSFSKTTDISIIESLSDG